MSTSRLEPPSQPPVAPARRRLRRAVGWPALGVSALTCVGCTSGEAPPSPLPEPGFHIVEDYPAGPYGVSVGDVISPFVFEGYTNPLLGTGPEHRQIFGLPDFYNEGGDETYPPGSPFGAGLPKPRALLVNVGAVWCGPCQTEARDVLPEEYARYKPLGGEFLMNLDQGAVVGTPATFSELDVWVNVYDVSYPSVLDEKQQLGSLFDPNSHPANIIVDTHTMQIVEAVSGVPQESFWSKFDEVLAE